MVDIAERKFVVVGVTGPSGSGKTEASTFFGKNGLPVIDTDKIARIVVEPGKPCLNDLVEAFSDAILKKDGTLNRSKLACIAFSSKEKTQLLNDITHPFIIEESDKMLKELEKKGENIAVIDAALLFESGMDKICDFTIAVLASAKNRLKRILKRDNITLVEAKARMKMQKDDEYYISRADLIIDGNGNLEEFKIEVEKALFDIKKILA